MHTKRSHANYIRHPTSSSCLFDDFRIYIYNNQVHTQFNDFAMQQKKRRMKWIETKAKYKTEKNEHENDNLN